MRAATLICLSALLFSALICPISSEVIYRNPRVYEVDYSFELVPGPAKIDRGKDLKLWIPIPRDWDSQKAVNIISVQPRPHGEYEDPEHGNRTLFWDFGKGPEEPSYKVQIKFRLEAYEIRAKVDPERVGHYDKSSKEYGLYTRSTRLVCITPKVKELARTAIGNERNPYTQAKRILEFVRGKVRFKQYFGRERPWGVKHMLDSPIIDQTTGVEYYEGDCEYHSELFVALCRAVGIPARIVRGLTGWSPRIEAEDLKPRPELERKLLPGQLAGARVYTGLGVHAWAEFYLPNYGWIPVDASWGMFGHLPNKRVIMSKSSDFNIGPHAPQGESGGYGSALTPLHNGRAALIWTGAWNIAKTRTCRATIVHRKVRDGRIGSWWRAIWSRPRDAEERHRR